MKIAVAGTGYVGLSNAIILARHNKVFAVDVFRVYGYLMELSPTEIRIF